jgi:predicted acylesterase/phospholipase RssA
VKKHLSIGVTNVLNGAFSTFNEHHPISELLKILQASLSFPGITPPVEAFDSLYFSGASIYENDVMGAINHCERLGY